MKSRNAIFAFRLLCCDFLCESRVVVVRRMIFVVERDVVAPQNVFHFRRVLGRETDALVTAAQCQEKNLVPCVAFGIERKPKSHHQIAAAPESPFAAGQICGFGFDNFDVVPFHTARAAWEIKMLETKRVGRDAKQAVFVQRFCHRVFFCHHNHLLE